MRKRGRLAWRTGAVTTALISLVVAGRARLSSAPQPHAHAAQQVSGWSCPAGGRLVAPGSDLQAAIDAAVPGSVLCLGSGTFSGPLTIHNSIALIGSRAAVVRSNGQGHTITVLAPHVVLRGFTIDGSGSRNDKMDAAVYVHADDVVASELRIRRALFGLVAEQSNEIRFTDNEIIGDPATPMGLRGDGIRFWEVRKSIIARNRLRDSRDIVVWYSPGNRLTGNDVRHSRYANHLMYSSDCTIEGNDYRDNIVGVFLMYSHDIVLRNNTLANNTKDDGMGVGAKESGNLTIEHNLFAGNNLGLYVDTSPFGEKEWVMALRNTFVLNGAGVTFHSSEKRNAFTDNLFQANQANVAIEGRGNALGVFWRGNYFDDYRGYDLNGDAVGDVAYEVRSLSARLVADHPDLAFFRGTPALELVDVVAELLPVLQPDKLLIDAAPRTKRPAWSIPLPEGD